jgi:protein-S-isoprenylcysteine O-methyltransferase Ste14
LRAVQLAVMLTFAVLISDFRRRQGAAPLVPVAAVVILKLLYPIPFVTYLLVVVRLRQVAGRELLALALTASGTALVACARRDIGRSYTWTGYRLMRPLLVTRGIYAHVRHPIYEGIWLFMAGGIVTVFGRVSLAAHVVAGLALVYIGAFLTVAASRETRFLAAAVGEDFEAYRRRVGAFWPAVRRG